MTVTFDVNTILTLLVAAFAIDRIYRYSVAKLKIIERPLFERREVQHGDLQGVGGHERLRPVQELPRADHVVRAGRER